MLKNNLLLLILVLFVSSCGKSYDSQEEMIAFIADSDNGYSYKKTINGVDYTLQYRPTDLMVKLELLENHDSKKVSALRKKYSKYLYFNLSMSKNNEELLNSMTDDKDKFAQMVDELVFRMQEKVHLYTPTKDTIQMIDFIYPRMYGTTNATTTMFIYPRDKKLLDEEYLNFTIQDLGLYTGEVKFKIKTKPLRNEPKLNL